MSASPVPEPDGPAAARPRVQSAARAIAILLAVARSDNGLTPKEISDHVGIGRQATYHLLHTLVQAGVLTRDDRRRYLLGLRVGTLAEGFDRQLSPPEHLGPAVRDVAQRTGETAYGAGWTSGEIAVLSVAPGQNVVHAATVPRGYVGNAHARASGKLLLAFAPPERREEYLRNRELTRLTPGTIATRDDLDRELERIRAQGYATDHEEFAEGLCCVAVPLDGGYAPFVLSLSAPSDRFAERFPEYLQQMRDVAAQISGEPPGDIDT